MYGLSAKEKTVCCREVAVSAGGSIVFSPYYCACPSFSGNSIRGKMGNENFRFANNVQNLCTKLNSGRDQNLRIQYPLELHIIIRQTCISMSSPGIQLRISVRFYTS